MRSLHHFYLWGPRPYPKRGRKELRAIGGAILGSPSTICGALFVDVNVLTSSASDLVSVLPAEEAGKLKACEKNPKSRWGDVLTREEPTMTSDTEGGFLQTFWSWDAVKENCGGCEVVGGKESWHKSQTTMIPSECQRACALLQAWILLAQEAQHMLKCGFPLLFGDPFPSCAVLVGCHSPPFGWLG